ncbi:MAG: DUF1841 family protein [candidate division Zixibacteria bacterium]|nr:DUF1841 family protein [candidate division Zixibacteria bacterium]
MSSTLDELKKLNHERLYSIWKIARAGDLDVLGDEDMRLGRIMLEHEEYHNQFEIADHLHDHEYDAETEVNPFLHIAFHQIVENQLEAKEPIEAYQFCNAMQKKKMSRHDVIHFIGSIIAGLIYACLKEQKAFDLERYKSLLKKYKNKNPKKLPNSLDNDFDWERE